MMNDAGDADGPLAAEARSAFLARMAHEVRTPLTTVIGVLDILKRSPLDEAQRRHVDLAADAAANVLEIVDTFLLHAALAEDMVTVEARPLSVARKLALIVARFEPCAAAKGLTLDAHIDPTLSAYRLGDPDQILRVLSALVDNAVKFTDHGAITIEAHSVGEDQVRVDVTDTGAGVCAEMAVRLFDPFHQGDMSRTRGHDGAGLGLAIAQRLARLMGGDIHVRSDAVSGATFSATFTLPLADPQAATQSVERRRRIRDLDPLRRTRSLVVDDSAAHRNVLRLLLEALDHDVEVAEDGPSALAALERRRFDVIVMDVRMPTIDGCAATRAIRALPDGRASTPVIGMSADSDARLRASAFAAGMNAFVPKPIVALELSRAITQVLYAAEDGSPDARGGHALNPRGDNRSG